MSVFDGLTGVLNATFGAPVTVTPKVGSPVQIVAQFRENAREVMTDAGVPVWVDTPTLQVARAADGSLPAAIVKGSLVEPSIRPGEAWRIRDIYRDRSPALDAYAVCALEVPRR